MKNNKQDIQFYQLTEFDDVAVREVSNTIKLLLEGKKVIHIALSGGSTPLPILEKLKDEVLDWERIYFFLVDERCVPLTSTESNFSAIKNIFFDFIPSKAYAMFDGTETPEKSASLYEEIIDKTLPKNELGTPLFDLVLLGMGTDGHIASLFPSTKALLESKRMIVSNYVPQLSSTRISFTYPLIIAASHKIMFIKGKEKTQILKDLENQNAHDYPVNKIYRESNIKWLVGEL